jgi:hypothetical protein
MAVIQITLLRSDGRLILPVLDKIIEKEQDAVAVE